jgi:hypothetical protein
VSGEEPSGRGRQAPLVVRPSPRRLVGRIAFLALFAVFAWLLIRLDWPRLAPAAVLFVGVPVVFILDALITFRVRLCLDADGISHTGKFGRWHRRWQDLAAWTHREFRGFNDPVAVVIRLHPKSGGPPLRISSALVFYKDQTYRAVYEGLTRHLGPPSPEFMVR